MNDENNLLSYDVKVLLALAKSLQGDKVFFKYLAENGYLHLAAWSNAVRGDREALKWLFLNNYGVLGVLSNAIDGEPKAVDWILNTRDEFLINFAAACRKEAKGYEWFVEKDLKVFVYMITEIRIVLKLQTKESMFPWYRWK